MENKWLMFKNYMHNELEISKEDIREWIDDSVREQAEKLVAKEFSNFDVHKIVQAIITDKKYYGQMTLKRDIADELTKQILERIKF